MRFSERFPEASRIAKTHLDSLSHELKNSPITPKYIKLLTETEVKNPKDLKKALKSKLWRLNNLYTITDKQAREVPFRLNYAQWKVYILSIGFKRVVIVKSRQQGISMFWVVCFIDDCIFNPNFKAGMVSYGDPQMQALLDRVRFIWDRFPQYIKTILNLKKETSNRTKELTFNNRSKLMITNNYRGDTIQRLHISELGKIASENPKRAEELMTGSLQALHDNSKAIAESTAEGENKLAEIWRQGVKDYDKESNIMLNPESFRPIFLSFLEDPSCVREQYQKDIPESVNYFKNKENITQERKNFWIAKYTNLGEDVYKEFPASAEEAFRLKTEGAVYAALYNQFTKRRTDLNKPFIPISEGGIYNPSFPLYVSFDLGVNDPTVAIWFQAYCPKTSSEMIKIPKFRILYEKLFQDHEASMKNISDCLKQVLETVPASGSGPAKYSEIILPFDAKQRSQQEKVQTRFEILYELGWQQILTTKKISKESISNVKELLQYLEIDVNHCPKTDVAFRNLKRKRDNMRNIWLDDIQHDDHSHPMDAVAYGINHTYDRVFHKPGSDYDFKSIVY